MVIAKKYAIATDNRALHSHGSHGRGGEDATWLVGMVIKPGDVCALRKVHARLVTVKSSEPAIHDRAQMTSAIRHVQKLAETGFK